MEDTLDIEPEHAVKLAKEYLAGNWLNSSRKTLSLKILSGGYCSRLYLCEDLTGSCEPSKFLIRLNGGKILEGNDDLKQYNEGTESIVFFMHGHLGYGPQLLGSFKGGRLEEYIPSRTCNNQDLEDPNIRLQIARKLAKFHSMKLPVSKKPHPCFEVLHSTYKLYDTPQGRETLLRNSKVSGVDSSWTKLVDIPAEIDWIRQTLQKVGGRLVLSTNDMNKLNCLIRDVPDPFGEIVTLVDYEIGGTNWRGYDIGTHFVMWMADIDKPEGVSGVPFPDATIRRAFVAEYLRETQALNAYDNFDAQGLDSTDHVLMEADLMSLLFIAFVLPFMMKPPHESNPIFSDVKELYKFHTWSKVMAEFYVEHKKYFLEKYDSVLKSEAKLFSDDIEILQSTSSTM